MKSKIIYYTFLIILIILSSLLTESCNSRCDDLIFSDPSSSPYVLPYAVGKSYSLYQGYCRIPGHRNRLAYDFAMPIGTEVTSARSGVVVEIKNDFEDNDNRAGHNNRVVIQHNDGSLAWYAHLKKHSVNVSLGDTVEYGDRIGLCGTSGRSGNTPHLHFEVFSKYKYDYSDAIPISFYNLSGKMDHKGALIENERYEALPYEKTALLKLN